MSSNRTAAAAALQTLYGDRLNGVVLFGSYAHGDYDEESDIDLTVSTKPPLVDYTRADEIMQYVIHAYDHTDADALNRRMAVRPAHLDYVRQLKADGQFVLGGALLDPAGRMIGSMLMLDLETDEQLAHYLNADPYLVQGVWDKIDVKPFRRAEV